MTAQGIKESLQTTVTIIVHVFFYKKEIGYWGQKHLFLTQKDIWYSLYA